MGRKPGDGGFKKGAWSPSEDQILIDYVNLNGQGKWSKLSKHTGLERSGKSCRLRWLNYLRPNIKRGNISDDEDDLIIRLHNLLGNRWSLIAGRLPGRTDNEIKNYWNSILSKKVKHQTNNNKQSSHPSISPPTPTTFSSNPKGMDMLHMNNNTTEAARIYEADQGMPPLFNTEEKGSLLCDISVDLEVGQLCLSELLDLDIDDFHSTMRSTFGEDFCDLDEAYHDHIAAPIDQQPNNSSV